MPPHVSIVFKELYDEINSAKRQQWMMTNYCVLILAAIYAINLSDYSVLLIGIAVITAMMGSWLLLRVQCHLARSRIRLDKLHKTYFSEDELRAIGLSDKEINALDEAKPWRQYRRGWEFLIVLIAVLWVGAIVVFLSYIPDVSGAESAGL